ncbi:tryptophan synthase beta subunit-like PLP-dependent enzyme [Desarmillaria ectypa]|nr:tryptophan synthase beta subunit-like PLP-dependent enzyme [Desarmillaria ectypa]
MKYFSTRGGDQELSFEETVLTGLAPNGGLYIPVDIPSLPADWETDWKDYSFVDLSVAVLSLYISREEISELELRDLVAKSYAGFRHPDVTPLKKLDENKYILELWHGPTWAFKDVALQLLGNLFEFFLKRRNSRRAGGGIDRLTVVGATSGDTGSAAIYGLRNKANISIFILHPKDETSSNLSSVHRFNATHRLGAVNSINWARILAQTVYYFLAYFHLRRETQSEVQFVVPTGNFGDILAGYYVKRMGLPMSAQLGVATNANDILARFWKTGRYEKVDSAPELQMSDGKKGTQDVSGVKETLSPAMDILISSNFERLLWYLAFESVEDVSDVKVKRTKAGQIIDGWMEKMKKNGKVEVPVKVLESARRDFCAERVSDEETLETIRSHFLGSPSYVVDPHTAVGLTAAARMAKYNSPSAIQIILSTAHPAKFSEAVSQALQSSSQFDFDLDVMPEEFKGLLQKERRVIDVERPDVELVKEVIERYV